MDDDRYCDAMLVHRSGGGLRSRLGGRNLKGESFRVELIDIETGD